MDRGGAETLRVLVRWHEVEPQRGTYDWSATDAIAEAMRGRRSELLPFVYGSPAWISDAEDHPPIRGAAERRAWRAFLTALVQRYGRGGEFWAGRRGANPIRRWQIWNEPNFEFYWEGEPDAGDYVRLLKISAAAIRRADRGAEVVAAGIAPIHSGVPWWTFLRDLYRQPGFERSFDLLALHPYSPTLRDLSAQVQLARRIMAANGDSRERLAITELGWSSGSEQLPLVVGRRNQARLLAAAFELLGNPRHRIAEVGLVRIPGRDDDRGVLHVLP